MVSDNNQMLFSVLKALFLELEEELGELTLKQQKFVRAVELLSFLKISNGVE
jgi:hypothetical protein